ncbi:hypothetical protein IE81DRAFT_331656 [Ceraceosorus guamensis]|uniref:Uncharacterized protein n=1 Tax=Ceraceosorus guamensis TaxID=1522189 RepID=A0A316VVF0_9BASI|nr:hypothetical protein IE81DRAFT_331656 [Ceraceosorus guamensis]PWN40423.1 hypothetical protein IE81DRAFT_331656 [Ceraceosorus guamensis]
MSWGCHMNPAGSVCKGKILDKSKATMPGEKPTVQLTFSNPATTTQVTPLQADHLLRYLADLREVRHAAQEQDPRSMELNLGLASLTTATVQTKRSKHFVIKTNSHPSHLLLEQISATLHILLVLNVVAAALFAAPLLHAADFSFAALLVALLLLAALLAALLLVLVLLPGFTGTLTLKTSHTHAVIIVLVVVSVSVPVRYSALPSKVMRTTATEWMKMSVPPLPLASSSQGAFFPLASLHLIGYSKAEEIRKEAEAHARVQSEWVAIRQ